VPANKGSLYAVFDALQQKGPEMNTRIVVCSALLLFAVDCGTCLALISVENVSKARAKELGIEVRAKPNGPKEAWIELEFKPAGMLEDFNHVSLEIAVAGKFQLGWTPLKHERTSTGTVVVRLMGNREFLENVTLRVVSGVFEATGSDLRVKDFIDLKKLR